MDESWRLETDWPLLFRMPNSVSSWPSNGPRLGLLRSVVVSLELSTMRYWHPAVSWPMFGHSLNGPLVGGVTAPEVPAEPKIVTNPATAANAAMSVPI